jgi:hypothetical protein
MIPFTGCEESFIYLFTANPIPIKIAVTTRNPIIFFHFIPPHILCLIWD